MGGKKKQTVGYKYYLGIHFALCYGPIDRLRRILSGDREAWAGNVTSNTTIDIDAPQLFGGDQREGGIVGPAKILMGGATQVCPSDLAALLSAPVPGFRGVTTVYFNGQVTANNPAPKPFAFDVTRILQGWDGGEAWYPEKAEIPIPGAIDSAAEAAFTGLSWLLPCGTSYGGLFCTCPATSSDSSVFDAPAGITYDVTLRIRGVAELVSYSGGTLLSPSYFYQGATGHSPGLVNVYRLSVSSPAADYYVNNGTFVSSTCTALDYEVTIPIDGGATVTLFADSIDAGQVNNDNNLTAVDDDPLHPIIVSQPYNGQFLQVDPVSVSGGNTALGMNPAHILYECLTDSRWGMGYPVAIIDDASFRAAADTLYDEGLGLCLMWSAPEALAEFIRRVLNHCGGILYSDPSTGQFALKLIRADYVAGDLPLYDEAAVLVLESFQRAGYGELVGEIVVVYHDVDTDENTPIKWQNPATINAQAGLISETREYPGIPSASLAARIAERDGIAASTPLARIRFTVNRTAWRLIPGDVFRFSWAKHGLSAVVFRVLSINRGTLSNGQITIEAAEDVFGLPASSYVNQEPTGWEPPDTAPQIITTQTVLELPYWTLAIYEGDALATSLDPDIAYFSPVAARTGGTDLAYRIWSRVGMAAYDDQDLADFVPMAIIDAALDEQATIIALTGAVDLASVVVGDLAFVGDGRDAEWLLITAIDTGVPEITVSRGVLDTTPRAHAAGTTIWFTDGKGQEDSTERATGQTVDFKLATISTGGELDYNLATEISETADQRQARPYPPGNVAINGEAWPTLIIDDALTVTWAHRDRLQQTAYIVEQTEGDIGPEAGTTYTVASYDDDSNELLDTSAGISGTSYSPTILDTHRLRIEITAQRDGIDSWQAQIRTFDYVGPDGRITDDYPLTARDTDDGDLRATE